MREALTMAAYICNIYSGRADIRWVRRAAGDLLRFDKKDV